MAKQLILLALAAVAMMSGVACSEGDGPNDPVVSGQDINNERMQNLSEEEKQRMAEADAQVNGPGSGGGGR